MSARLQTLGVVTLVVVVMLGAVLAPSSATAANIYLATRNLSPGPVLRIAGATEALAYIRPGNNNLTSFTIGPSVEPTTTTAVRPTRLYYCNAVNQNQIFRAGDVPIYTHRTYVREVAFGPGGALYFSESTGASADGKIYRLGPGMVPVLYYTVVLTKVGGFWAGNFAFNSAGRLFISNGNTTGAKIWGCPLGAAAPVALYSDRGPIQGFCVTSSSTFWFTNGTPVLRRGTFGGPATMTVFTSPKQNKYCDVLASATVLSPNTR
jgi:hypothetical protein